ncbi:MAG: hypothetical protein ACKO4T_04810 [Planctomycetaceae bacterium]
MLSLLMWVLPCRVRRPWFAGRAVLASVGVLIGAAPLRADDSAAVERLGVAVIPQDAAFVSSSLRLREQYEAVVGSNAFTSILALPAVRRALDSLEEQRFTPGSALSTFDTFMQMPENADAAELLADMVATDTFVYGEPSCVSFWKLVRKLAEAQQRAGVAPAAAESDIVVESIEDDDPPAADEMVGAADASLQARALIATLADNLDLIVVPDVVWGFTTTKRDLADDQIRRIESLVGSMLQAAPDLARSVARRKTAGGEMLTLTLDGESIPWAELERETVNLTGDAAAAAKVFGRLKTLDLVVAIGVVGDRMIVSLGDSADHLDKLATPESGRRGLLSLPAFAPLLADAGRRLTGIAYMSEQLCDAAGSSRSDLDAMLGVIDQLDETTGLTAEARSDVRGLAEKAVEEWAKRLPEAGPWMSYAFMTDDGYEGYSWNWARNQPFDGSRRLDLLEHAGGAPLAVAVSRIKDDPAGFDAMVELVQAAWGIVGRHAGAALDDGQRQAFDTFGGMGSRLATIVRDKLGRSLADGQLGFVLDAKGKSRKLQGDLPPSADPLPLVEPALVLSIADPKLFREGLSDVFALGDEFTAALKRLEPGSVPEGYRIPEPEKSKTDEGSVWSWKLVNSRLDDQVRPAIGVGERTAVLSLAPKQAGRLLAESRLETGSQMARFDEPLAAAAACDFAGVVDAIEPWIVYVTRYGCVQEREGVVDPDAELSAADETPQAKEVLEHVHVVLAALKSLRAGVSETTTRDDALVTHWRNVIRDIPAK